LTSDFNHELDERMGRTLQTWSEAGTLPPEGSYQLERLVYQMSHQYRRGRLVSVLRGTIAALVAYITMLFFACPAAGSLIPAAEALVDRGASPPTAALEQLVYNPAAPLSYSTWHPNMKGAQS